MSKSKSPTEWLEKVLDAHAEYYIGETMKFFQNEGESPALSKNNKGDLAAKQAILNQVEELVNEVIEVSRPVIYNKGAEPIGGMELTDFYCKAREDLRVEQHTKKRQLLKGKD